ncbi:MAG TPA: ABC transporter permease [Methanocella sp.]|nr:ABC transporter permease [Methanocella sp.]
MSELQGIYTLWMREVLRYSRERSRFISSFIQPLLWLIIFGAGISLPIQSAANITYQMFIFPGIITQALQFTSMFMGISVIWDRQFGFLKEILVAPISRISIFLGKMLGVSTDAIVQGIIIFPFGILIGVPLNPAAFIISVPVMMLITFGVVCVGLTIASYLESLESFGLIQTFVNLPLFFLSGALFPVTHIPSWLRWVFYANPLTYGVDILRSIILGNAWTPLLPLYQEILIILIFDITMILIGSFSFSRRN